MPSDISFEVVSQPETKAVRRLPLGVGLAIGAIASLALWSVVGLALKTLFF